MTEAVIVLLHWALIQPMVTAVIAETDKNNKASQKVIGKVGMKFYYETEREIWWRIKI
jgi:RimJ/RimL family protein N-acetyltransferase